MKISTHGSIRAMAPASPSWYLPHKYSIYANWVLSGPHMLPLTTLGHPKIHNVPASQPPQHTQVLNHLPQEPRHTWAHYIMQVPSVSLNWSTGDRLQVLLQAIISLYSYVLAVILSCWIWGQCSWYAWGLSYCQTTKPPFLYPLRRTESVFSIDTSLAFTLSKYFPPLMAKCSGQWKVDHNMR